MTMHRQIVRSGAFTASVALLIAATGVIGNSGAMSWGWTSLLWLAFIVAAFLVRAL